MDRDWQNTVVADDESHHLVNETPFYQQRFKKVLKFHAPGLAAVADEKGAYHIHSSGESVYQARYLQTFGYYQGLAAVESAAGWLHINAQGEPAYPERFAWCGNFQEGLCTVQDLKTRGYYHIDQTGQRIYQASYGYVGDYRDGIAVVCTDQGLHTHINQQGHAIHHQWFLGLDVFHKGVARAKDEDGWFHIDKAGKPLYQARYRTVEPYYNNVAHVEDKAGNLLTIDLSGKKRTSIYQNQPALLHELSSDLVGFWKTQTIYAAVKLGVFDELPNSLEHIASKLNLANTICLRLLRALQELNLIQCNVSNVWQLTEKGALLKPIQNSAMAAAAIVWGDSHYQRWTQLLACLEKPDIQAHHYFNELARDKFLVATYQQALKGYAEYDYKALLHKIDWQTHQHVLDAGGGIGTLLHLLVNNYPHLNGILLEMAEVVKLINPHPQCHYHHVNLLDEWPVQADAIILARVLHDWSDESAIKILGNAKKSLIKMGKIYVLEMILDPHSAKGGLLDLNMLVMTGGRERTLEDWQHLAFAATLRINDICELSSVVNCLVLSSAD